MLDVDNIEPTSHLVTIIETASTELVALLGNEACLEALTEVEIEALEFLQQNSDKFLLRTKLRGDITNDNVSTNLPSGENKFPSEICTIVTEKPKCSSIPSSNYLPGRDLHLEVPNGTFKQSLITNTVDSIDPHPVERLFSSAASWNGVTGIDSLSTINYNVDALSPILTEPQPRLSPVTKCPNVSHFSDTQRL